MDQSLSAGEKQAQELEAVQAIYAVSLFAPGRPCVD